MKIVRIRTGISRSWRRLRNFFALEQLRRYLVQMKDGIRIAWKIFNEKGVLSHASVCSYSTMLSLVPILAISLAILNAFSPSDPLVTPEEADQIEEEILHQKSQAQVEKNLNLEPFEESEAAQDIRRDLGNPARVAAPPTVEPVDELVALEENREETFSEQVFNFFFEHFIPGIELEQDREVDLAKKQLIVIIQRAASLRFVILVFLVITSVSLFYSIEHAFNEIWAVRNRRSLFSQFLAFWILLTVTPLLLGLSYYYTTQIESSLAVKHFMEKAWGKFIFQHLVSYVLTLFAFMIANRFLPNVNVKFLPAFIGSALSAVLFEISKFFFDYYISSITSQPGNYYTIFEKLAAIPIFILWLYYCYLCFLIGPVIATTIQNFDQHVAQLYRYSWKYSPRPIQAIYIFIHICRTFRNNKTGLSLQELEEDTGILPEHLRRSLRSLEQARLVHMDRQGRFFPNADPMSLTVGDVLQQIIGLDKERDDRLYADQRQLNEIVHSLLFNQNNVSIGSLLTEEPPSDKRILLHQKS